MPCHGPATTETETEDVAMVNGSNSYINNTSTGSCSIHESLEQLYQSTPWSVTTEESFEMDCFLHGLQTPAHQSFFVIRHALSCSSRTSKILPEKGTGADIGFATALSHCRHLLKPNHRYIINQELLKDLTVDTLDESSLLEPGAYYNIIQKETDDKVSDGWISLETYPPTVINPRSNSTKRIVDEIVRHQAIVSATATKRKTNTHRLLQNLYHHLNYSLGTDVRNGAAAEIALSLSMAGICTSTGYGDANINVNGTSNKPNEDSHADPPSNPTTTKKLLRQVMDVLTHIATLELIRKRTKGSRRAIDILMVVEKLAAAGCCYNPDSSHNNEYFGQACQAAALSLVGSKNYENLPPGTLEEIVNMHRPLHMWSLRPLLWLFRRSHLFHKVSQQDILSSISLDSLLATSASSIAPRFDNPALPLVVDVGCGLGVSLLGLAAGFNSGRSLPSQAQPSHPLYHLDWTECNYLGGDLSPKAIQWASSMATWWGVTGRCQFLQVSTEILLEYLSQHASSVPLILLQFPTPYRLQQNQHPNEEDNNKLQDGTSTKIKGGNDKLPTGPTDASFMVNPKNLQRIVDLMQSKTFANQHPSRHLLVQSNCEDVALYVYTTLVDLGLEAVDSEVPRTLPSEDATTRTKEWLSQNEGRGRRATGAPWAAEPYLPILTETEAACEYQETPIHRCLFRAAIR